MESPKELSILLEKFLDICSSKFPISLSYMFDI